MHSFSLLAAAALSLASFAQAGTVKVDVNNLPQTTEKGQYGYNNCYDRTSPKGKDSPTSKCQTLWVGSAEDFCIFGPKQRMSVGAAEPDVVAYCTKKGHGARLIPKGTFKNMHFIRTQNYIQITGLGDFTKINVAAGDEGGELDPHGPTGLGNPVGGIVVALDNNGKRVQIIEWSQFLAHNEVSIRLCFPGPDAAKWCPHRYDVMGSMWNHPGNYGSGFDSCKANNVALPAGIYKKGSGYSTWYQGVKPTPTAQKAAATSQCKKISAVGTSY